MRSRSFRRALCLSCFALALVAFTSASAAETASSDRPSTGSHALTPAPIDPANMLLFSVDLDGLTLTDGMDAYGQAQDPLLPVAELTRLLEMDVDVLPADRRIEGRLGEARTALLVDLNTGLARVGAKEVSLTDGDVALTPTDIYLRASAIEKLLPLKLVVKPDDLMVHLTATELLPIQTRMQRMGRRPAGDPAAASDQPALKIANPYRLFSPPSADVTVGLGAQSAKPRIPAQYEIRLAGDLLYSDFQAYLSSDENGRPASARFLLERRSLEGDLLGPLHARDVTVGDIVTPSLTLGARSATGRGVSISTEPLEQSSVFNRIDLRGDLPNGYQVELYINEVLRGQQNTPINGMYEFLNVPLTPGMNVIRTVTYGPRGERTEETRIINVGAGLLHRGEAQLQFGVVQQDLPLLKLPGDNSSSLDTGITRAGGLRVVGVLDYGLTNFLTLETGAAMTPPQAHSQLQTANGQPDTNDPRTHQSTSVYNLGLRGSIFGLATQVDGAIDSFGGRAEDLSIAGGNKTFSTVLRHTEYQNGFYDENNLGADADKALLRRSELTGDLSIGLRGRIIPVSLRVLHDGYTDGSSDLQASARMSTSIGRALYSADLEYEQTNDRGAQPSRTLTGYLAASTYAAFNWQLRATLDYDLLPAPRLDSLSLTADHPISDKWSIHLAAGDTFNQLSAFTVEASTSYHTKIGDLSLTADYGNQDHSWELLTQWNFGIGYNPADHGYRLTRTGPGSGGSALIDAFIDENGNGVHDPGEPPAPNLLVGGGAGEKIATGRDGMAYLTGLGTSSTARLSMDLDQLDNTSVKAPPTAVQFPTRQGNLVRVPYPLQPTGGVAVTIMLKRGDGQTVGLSSVKVDLVPQHGDPIELTTEFDGSAVFDQVPVGSYQLALNPAQAKQLRMHLLSEPPAILIKSDGSLTPDVKAEVAFDPAPETASAQQPAG